MAEKTLKTRIALLRKTYAEWEAIKSTYIPLKGEVCFCDNPINSNQEIDNTACILFKVGTGTTVFGELPWASTIAADVYTWAKKENLEFGDLSNDFKTALTNYINNTIAGPIAELDEIKVDKVIEGANGKALIFNESDGGGAKFENSNGIESFVGVNDGNNGIVAQIYADKLIDGKWFGAKLDVSNTGIYYTVGDKNASERMIDGNKLATLKDIEACEPESMSIEEIEDICK